MARPNAQSLAAAFSAYLKEQDLHGLLPEIVTTLQEEVWRNQDISVILAADPPEAERRAIAERLTRQWGEHRVVFSVDPALLTGMVVRFQDQVLDLSGRADLRSLGRRLTADEDVES